LQTTTIPSATTLNPSTITTRALSIVRCVIEDVIETDGHDDTAYNTATQRDFHFASGQQDRYWRGGGEGEGTGEISQRFSWAVGQTRRSHLRSRSLSSFFIFFLRISSSFAEN